MEDQDLIRDQMDHTRSSLADKLETLEERVATTSSGASQDVAQTVETVTDSVQETVETVKDTIEETLAAVKNSVGAVKRFFDVPMHVDRHPWIALGGSLAIGYMIGQFVSARTRGRPTRNHDNSARQELLASAVSNNSQSNGHHSEWQVSQNSGGLLERFEPELSKLNGLAIGALMGVVRDMVVKTAGRNLSQSVSEIIDSVTEKIGGTPVGPVPMDENNSGLEEQSAMPV